MHILHFFLPLLNKSLREWGCSFPWSSGKVMRNKSVKMVFVTSIIFWFFCSKVIFDQRLFSIAAKNLTTRGPLYTCLVEFWFCFELKCKYLSFSPILWAPVSMCKLCKFHRMRSSPVNLFVQTLRLWRN